MKALVWLGGQTYEVQDVPDPRPTPGQVVVKVALSAICGSDLHLADWSTEPPVIPGHEASGTIADAGEARGSSGSRIPKLGDRVALDPVQRCGDCYACTHGIPHLCSRCRHLGGASAPGTWAEYVAVDARNAHLVPDGLSMESAALAEPAAVCVESLRRAGLQAGGSVVVIGDGPFGFLHAQIARALRSGSLVVAGHHDRRLERISQVTDAVTCNTHRDDLQEVVRREAGDDGVDIVVEATGSGQAPNVGLPLLRPRGSLVIFSYIWKPEPLDMGLISMRELNVLGSCRSLDAFDLCLRWMRERRIDVEALLDLRVPMSDWRQALETLRTDKASLFKAALIP